MGLRSEINLVFRWNIYFGGWTRRGFLYYSDFFSSSSLSKKKKKKKREQKGEAGIRTVWKLYLFWFELCQPAVHKYSVKTASHLCLLWGNSNIQWPVQCRLIAGMYWIPWRAKYTVSSPGVISFCSMKEIKKRKNNNAKPQKSLMPLCTEGGNLQGTIRVY